MVDPGGRLRFRPALAGWAAAAVAASASLSGCGQTSRDESDRSAAADASTEDAAAQSDASLADAIPPTGGVCPELLEDVQPAQDADDAEVGGGGATAGLCPS